MPIKKTNSGKKVVPKKTGAKKEFTTQKLRQEWAAEQDQFYEEIKEKVMKNFEDDSKQFRPITEDAQNDS